MATTEETKALFRKFYEELFNRKNLGVFEQMTTPNPTDNGLPPGFPPGREGSKQFVGMYFSAFPDLQINIEDLVAEGDKVVGRVSYRGTHKGELMGIPATGKVTSVSAMEILRFEGDKIAEHWSVVDQLGMMQQLGVIPAPGQAG
jgi:steroid delta-isomerase-like uncharacterized protein